MQEIAVDPPYYRHHVFICVNRRDAGRRCCGGELAQGALERTKARVRELGLNGPGGVQVSSSGCMNRCARGPVIVVYPEGAWHSYASAAEAERIVVHLLGAAQTGAPTPGPETAMQAIETRYAELKCQHGAAQ